MTSDLELARRRIQAAYDPELVRRAGGTLANLLADHLHRVEHSSQAVLNWADPRRNVEAAKAVLNDAPFSPTNGTEPLQPEAFEERFSQLAETMLARGQNLHDPRYVGHQVPASVPVAGLFDAIGSLTNQVMAIYEMGPWATAVEEAMVETLGEQIGWKAGEFAGIVTHGGSLANLTGLLTARNVCLGDAWERGVSGRSEAAPVLVAHGDAHYSAIRAAGILGLGTDQVIRTPLDEQRKIDPQALDETLRRVQADGHPVIAVIACACATPIGAFDPLAAIAEVCREHGVWLHVDAAHGAAACLSPRYRHLVEGLHRADSVVWDAHKMLFVPALCAFVFFGNKEHRFEAFRQDAPYLFDPMAPGLADYDSGLKTVECTKRAAAFGLWGLWASFGPQLFADMVDVTFATARQLYDKLQEAPDFEPLHQPECNILAFRYVPEELREASREQLGEFQLQLRRAVIQSGQFYLVPVKLDGLGALRVTLINPLTNADHLDQLLATLRRTGRELLQG